MLGTAPTQADTEHLERVIPPPQNVAVPRKRGRPPILAKSIKKAALLAKSAAESLEKGTHNELPSPSKCVTRVSVENPRKIPVSKETVSSEGSISEKHQKGDICPDLKGESHGYFDGDSFGLNDELHQLRHGKNHDSELSNTEFRRELENLGQLANSLRQQYRELERVGVSEAQENFIKYKIATDEKIQSYQEYSDYLEKKVEKLEIDALKAEEDLRNAMMQKDKVIRSLEKASERIREFEASIKGGATSGKSLEQRDQIRLDPSAADTLETTLNLYKELTGVDIYAVEHLYSHSVSKSESASSGASQSDSLIFWCKQSGRKGQIHYSLVIPNSALDKSESSSNKKHIFVYKPIKEDIPSYEKQKLQKTPSEWHKTSVEFEQKMASLFFWRLSSYLHDQN